MEEIYVTVVGAKYYAAGALCRPGRLALCVKEPENEYDADAVKVVVPASGKVGYVANSVRTVARGTLSAGRVYDRVGDRFFVRVRFVYGSCVICSVERGDEGELEREMLAQLMDDETHEGHLTLHAQ